jgi:hypothetical protein
MVGTIPVHTFEGVRSYCTYRYALLRNRAVDPDSLDPDPDTGSKTEEENTAKNLFYLFFVTYCNLLMSKQQEKPSALKREHPARQKIIFIKIFVIFALLDPDPDCESGSGYGSRDPTVSGSTALFINQG